ncbi:hypothetical protein M9H77_06327 [Catharanthus roseus]|uniref:Uncharacterized protein n=1 Tax=Catharanthus roseus TaxID=4058 RepID=A0ACC0BS16_CATRO|nr:hypothetical protein M9H77_06327 [Catharanthus roseus]
MLSGIETITNCSWCQLIDDFALASFQNVNIANEIARSVAVMDTAHQELLDKYKSVKETLEKLKPKRLHMQEREDDECSEFPKDLRMRLELEQSEANQESESQMEQNGDLEQGGEEQPSEQVASKDDSAIHVDKLIIDVKHTEIKMDGNMIPKLVKKSLLLVEKKVFLLMGRRKMTSKPCSVCECACLSIKSIRKYEASAISLDGLWTLYISPSIMLRS